LPAVFLIYIDYDYVGKCEVDVKYNKLSVRELDALPY
jgi:hypothetical protein